MILHAPDGFRITTVEQWLEHAPPTQGARHWQDYRSAKETAKAWLRTGAPAVPLEVVKLLESCESTRGFRYVDAYPEHRICFDDCGEPRNSDVTTYGSKEDASIVVDIESKAEESFGSCTIGQARQKGLDTPGSRYAPRVDNLCLAVLGRPMDDELASLAYQLLYSLAAVACEAAREHATKGVLLIHEFDSRLLKPANVRRNARHLQEFVRQVPGWRNETIAPGVILPFVNLPGAGDIPARLPVTIAKVCTDLN